MPPPELPGVLDRRDLRRTGTAVSAVQHADGAIPWEGGRHLDPWDHVQAAMGLAVAGRREEAVRAYEWVRSQQRPDGSLAVRYRDGRPEAPAGHANGTLYLATGVWHHVLLTGDTGLAHRMWPTVRDAVGFALELQTPGGEIRWSRAPDGRVWHESLLTGSSSMYLSLRCALALADAVGEPQPSWELAAGRLGHAVAFHEERFADRGRWSMDWYYPVLGGALRGIAARHRLEEHWDRFVVPRLGVRCVEDRPWVTGAETCELALALAAVGADEHATRMVAAMQHLRDRRGRYWTGLVWPDAARWPIERTTWTAATVLLAVDAITGGPTRDLFAGTGLPAGVSPADVACGEDLCRPRAARGVTYS